MIYNYLNRERKIPARNLFKRIVDSRETVKQKKSERTRVTARKWDSPLESSFSFLRSEIRDDGELAMRSSGLFRDNESKRYLATGRALIKTRNETLGAPRYHRPPHRITAVFP